MVGKICPWVTLMGGAGGVEKKSLGFKSVNIENCPLCVDGLVVRQFQCKTCSVYSL